MRERERDMMNRICPSDTVLAEYMSGVASPPDRAAVERHLAVCRECRILLSEAHAVVSRTDIREILAGVSAALHRNRWALAAAVSLGCSFFFGKHFLQFLAAFLVSGGRWIAETKNRKMLIMINEAWKRGNAGKLDELLSSMKRG